MNRELPYDNGYKRLSGRSPGPEAAIPPAPRRDWILWVSGGFALQILRRISLFLEVYSRSGMGAQYCKPAFIGWYVAAAAYLACFPCMATSFFFLGALVFGCKRIAEINSRAKRGDGVFPWYSGRVSWLDVWVFARIPEALRKRLLEPLAWFLIALTLERLGVRGLPGWLFFSSGVLLLKENLVGVVSRQDVAGLAPCIPDKFWLLSLLVPWQRMPEVEQESEGSALVRRVG